MCATRSCVKVRPRRRRGRTAAHMVGFTTLSRRTSLGPCRACPSPRPREARALGGERRARRSCRRSRPRRGFFPFCEFTQLSPQNGIFPFCEVIESCSWPRRTPRRGRPGPPPCGPARPSPARRLTPQGPRRAPAPSRASRARSGASSSPSSRPRSSRRSCGAPSGFARPSAAWGGAAGRRLRG